MPKMLQTSRRDGTVVAIQDVRNNDGILPLVLQHIARRMRAGWPPSKDVLGICACLSKALRDRFPGQVPPWQVQLLATNQALDSLLRDGLPMHQVCESAKYYAEAAFHEYYAAGAVAPLARGAGARGAGARGAGAPTSASHKTTSARPVSKYGAEFMVQVKRGANVSTVRARPLEPLLFLMSRILKGAEVPADVRITVGGNVFTGAAGLQTTVADAGLVTNHSLTWLKPQRKPSQRNSA